MVAFMALNRTYVHIHIYTHRHSQTQVHTYIFIYEYIVCGRVTFIYLNDVIKHPIVILDFIMLSALPAYIPTINQSS